MGQLQRIVEETISALTVWDASALNRLCMEIEAIPTVELRSDDLAAAANAHRLLGALLHETERNLRLFRAISPCGAQSTSNIGSYAPCCS